MNGISDSKSRVALLLLGAAALAMLLASLCQRFMHPSLLVEHVSPQTPGERAATPAMQGIGALMEAYAKNPGDRELLSQLVENLMSAGQWDAAENFAQRLLTLDPAGQEQSRPLFLMAVIQHNQGRHAHAAELFEKLLSKKEDAAARYSLAIIYAHFLDNVDQARKHLEKALQAQDVPQALGAAIRDELAKLPPAKESQPATPAQMPEQPDANQDSLARTGE